METMTMTENYLDLTIDEVYEKCAKLQRLIHVMEDSE